MAVTKFPGTFAELLHAELRKLERTPEQRAFRPGDVILREGEFGDGIYVLHEGSVQISTALPGKDRRVLSMLGPGTFFGEMAVIDEGPRSATAVAATDVRASFIPSEQVWELLGQSPPLLVAMMRETIQRMRTSEPLFFAICFGSFQIVPRFRTKSDPSGANSSATGCTKLRPKVSAFAGESGSIACTQWFAQSAKNSKIGRAHV